jgi:hypothetical protein
LIRFIREVRLIRKEMAMRDELRGREVTDPVFGELTYGERNWEGEVELKALGGKVPLRVITWLGKPPSEIQQEVFKAFLADEEGFVRRAEQATFDYYRRTIRPDYLDLPDLQEPSELREVLVKPAVWVGLDDQGTPLSLEWEQPYPGKPSLAPFRYSVSFEKGEIAGVTQALEWMDA